MYIKIYIYMHFKIFAYIQIYAYIHTYTIIYKSNIIKRKIPFFLVMAAPVLCGSSQARD